MQIHRTHISMVLDRTITKVKFIRYTQKFLARVQWLHHSSMEIKNLIDSYPKNNQSPRECGGRMLPLFPSHMHHHSRILEQHPNMKQLKSLQGTCAED